MRAHLHCRQGPGLQDEAQQVSPDSGTLQTIYICYETFLVLSTTLIGKSLNYILILNSNLFNQMTQFLWQYTTPVNHSKSHVYVYLTRLKHIYLN